MWLIGLSLYIYIFYIVVIITGVEMRITRISPCQSVNFNAEELGRTCTRHPQVWFLFSVSARFGESFNYF